MHDSDRYLNVAVLSSDVVFTNLDKELTIK